MDRHERDMLAAVEDASFAPFDSEDETWDNVAKDLGCADPTDAGGVTETVAGEAPAEDDALAGSDPNTEAIAVVDAVSESLSGTEGGCPDAASSSAAASSSSALPDVEISAMGYVRCRKPPHSFEKALGLIGMKSSGKQRFANCHVHPRCSASVGMVRRDVPRDLLAQWLVNAKLVDRTLPVAQLLVETEKHRQLWRDVLAEFDAEPAAPGSGS